MSHTPKLDKHYGNSIPPKSYTLNTQYNSSKYEPRTFSSQIQTKTPHQLKQTISKSYAQFDGLLSINKLKASKTAKLKKKMNELLVGSSLSPKNLKLPHEVDICKFMNPEHVSDKESFYVKPRVFNQKKNSYSEALGRLSLKELHSKVKVKPKLNDYIHHIDKLDSNRVRNCDTSAQDEAEIILNDSLSPLTSYRSIGSICTSSHRHLSILGSTIPKISNQNSCSRLLSAIKFECLVNSCEKVIHKSRTRISSRLPTRKSKKVKSLKNSIKTPEYTFKKDYVTEAIKDFKSSKLAFVYGKEFKGHYISDTNHDILKWNNPE